MFDFFTRNKAVIFKHPNLIIKQIFNGNGQYNNPQLGY